MKKTLLAVGSWRACGKIVAAAMSNRWSVLHTQLAEDVQAALRLMSVDLILLTGCSTRRGWEHDARGAWDVCRDTPVVALGTNFSQDSLVCALLGAPEQSPEPSFDGRDDAEGAQTFSSGGLACSFKRLVLSPTLTLLEPRAPAVGRGIGRALDFIEEHFAEPLTLAQVAEVALYSRCHFSKVFKEQTGVSFVGYLTRVRVRRAGELLSRTDMPVTEVAFEVGFNDLSHFERVFRAAERLSPSKFRQRAKNLPGREKYPPSLSMAAVAS
ncbi:MAG TPA: AraC family transcriptional regulator [Pyrinomonadaceae bacterium]|nr:AraC family transcriptional regulator [Pyrinomonadaceae bacterium]